MFPEGSNLLDLSAAFDTELSDSVRPSAAGLLRLRVALPQDLIPPPQTVNPLASITAVKAACEESLLAAAALTAESAACAAAVAALVPVVSVRTQRHHLNATAKLPSSVCTGGCVPRVRALLGAGLAKCAKLWASMPILQRDLQFASGTVPLVLNTSWILQVPHTLNVIYDDPSQYHFREFISFPVYIHATFNCDDCAVFSLPATIIELLQQQ
jgi:hypothetical protein